jgi:hypothetical protein
MASLVKMTRANHYTRQQGTTAMQDKLSAVTYSASGLAVWGGITVTEWAAIIGTFVAVVSGGINWFYRHKHYKLAEARVRREDE